MHEFSCHETSVTKTRTLIYEVGLGVPCGGAVRRFSNGEMRSTRLAGRIGKVRDVGKRDDGGLTNR